MELLTYDSLRDVLRKQKREKSLIKLQKNFYSKAGTYISEIERTISELEKESDEFALKRLALKKEELENASATLKEICTLRGALLFSIAWEAAALSLPVSKENLLPEERDMFDDALKTAEKQWERLKQISSKKSKETVKKEVLSQRVKVKIKEPLPAFVGTDLNTYGPYEGGEVVELPGKIAEMLKKQGRAEKGEEK